MYNSIQQFLKESTKNFEKKIVDLIMQKCDLTDLSLCVEEEVLKLGNNIVVEMLQAIDAAIYESKARKAKWYVEHKNQGRTMVDVMGTLDFTRTGYVPKEGGKNVYLLDELLGIEPHQKATMAADARTLERAIKTSYEDGGKCVNPFDSLTKQTIKKLVHDTDASEVEEILPSKKKSIPILYVVADEDHVAAQFWEKPGDLRQSENGQKINTIMTKIIVVYEGVIDEAPKGSKNHRFRLVGKHTFCGVYKGEAENYRLWRRVADYIEAAYDTEALKRVYIAGDGAGWIKTGVDVIENSRFVLDKFHVMEYINKSVAHLPNADEIKKVIWESIYTCDFERLTDQFYNILDVTESLGKIEDVKGTFKYLKNNWDGVKIWHVEETEVRGCCAEGQVSHVLSDRLSSRPMGWSVIGCDHMAKLRAYTQNGGKVIDLLRYKKKHKEKILRRQEERELIQDLRRRKTGWENEEKIRAMIPGLEKTSMQWLRDIINSQLTS